MVHRDRHHQKYSLCVCKSLTLAAASDIEDCEESPIKKAVLFLLLEPPKYGATGGRLAEPSDALLLVRVLTLTPGS